MLSDAMGEKALCYAHKAASRRSPEARGVRRHKGRALEPVSGAVKPLPKRLNMPIA